MTLSPKQVLSSRTVWALILIALINGVDAIKTGLDTLDPHLYPAVNGLLLLLAFIFRVNPKQAVGILAVFFVLCQRPAEAQTFVASGVNGLATTSPKPAGWLAIATPLPGTKATDGVWSYSLHDYVLQGGKVTSSTCSGVATFLRSYGPLALWGAGTACFVTTGTNSGFGGTASPVALLRLGTTRFSLMGAYSIMSSTIASSRSVWAGFGYTFNAAALPPAGNGPATAPGAPPNALEEVPWNITGDQMADAKNRALWLVERTHAAIP